MARPCSVCTLPNRGDVDQALVAGLSYAEVSRRFAGTAISPDSVERHAKTHMKTDLAKALVVRAEKQADKALSHVEQLVDLHRRTLRILTEAEVAADPRTAIVAVREARSNLELMVELERAAREKPGDDLVEMRRRFVEAGRRDQRWRPVLAWVFCDVEGECPTVPDVLTSPEWLAMRGRILAVLERHPDALREVLDALEGAAQRY